MTGISEASIQKICNEGSDNGFVSRKKKKLKQLLKMQI